MICPKCKKVLKGSPSFCGYCGKEFAKAPAPKPAAPRPVAVPKPAPQPAVTATDNTAKCPYCGSTSLQAIKKGASVKKAAVGAFLVGPVGLLAGGIGMNDTIIKCLNCGYEIKK